MTTRHSSEVDVTWQLSYPISGGAWGTIDLTSMLLSEQGDGMAPLHYNTQRGIYQHGETPVSMRLDPRVIMLAISEEHGSRSQMYANLAQLLNRLSPARNWSTTGVLTKCIYRKIIPGGRMQWRSDLVTVSGSNQVTSLTGRFAEWGLGPGDALEILTGASTGTYIIGSVINENALTLTSSVSSTEVNVGYRVHTNSIIRELDVLLEDGPILRDDRQEATYAVSGVIKLVAHDPVWRNPLRQTATWVVQNTSNLIFYDPVSWPDRLVFPIWFGSDHISADTKLTYLGTWMARPMIIVKGPFTRILLENLSTGDKLEMRYAAGVGESVTINLEALTITNNYGHNLMRFMATPYAEGDSDLITFGLYPDPQVAGGVNDIRISVSQAQLDMTSATMSWQSRYIGA